MDETTPVATRIKDSISSVLRAALTRITRTGELRGRISKYSQPPTVVDSPSAQHKVAEVPPELDLSSDAETTPQELFDSPLFPQEFSEPVTESVPEPNSAQQDFSGEIKAIRGDISSIAAQIKEVVAAFSELTEAVYYMPASSEEPAIANEPAIDRSEIDDLRKNLQAIEKGLSKNGVTMITMEARSDEVMSVISDVGDTVSEIFSQQADFSGRLNELQESVGCNRSEISDLAASLDFVRTTISSIEGDVENLITAASEAEEAKAAAFGVGKVAEVEIVPPPTCVKLNSVGNEADQVMVAMELLDFLLELVGPNNLPSILDYYVEIGWISETARLELLAYAGGMDYPEDKADWKLSAEDHLKTLWFVEQLCGYKIDKNKLFRMGNEISKVRRGIDVIYEI
ncbi:MAG: hypothetical protein C5S47_03155 [Candidatus Methanogasteraceae archaeon]|nr:MAG: hypothetical protein C5S47_03155 [ANME-2 cluster archaeon]